MYDCSLILNETACDFLHKVIINCLDHEEVPNKIQETEIVSISDLKDMTFSYYMHQPKSMLCGELLRRFFEVKREEINHFEYNWLPGCLRVDN